jgi:hypothetical protein
VELTNISHGATNEKSSAEDREELGNICSGKSEKYFDNEVEGS